MVPMAIPHTFYKCKRVMDAVKEDMQVVGVRIEDTENRVKWKTVIRCGNP